MPRTPPSARTQRASRRPTRGSRPPLFELFAALAVIVGVALAVRLAWVCDDAFISFRYADNLAHGLGLVFNAGERVEGYSNFLWTLGIALGMRLGVDPEQWTVVWGVAFYAATIAVLCALPRRLAGGRGQATLALPLAGLVAAVHRDWNIYATSGLETSCFTFLVTLAYALAVVPSARAWMAGLALALAALTRPDGIVFVPFFLACMVLATPHRVRSGLEFIAAFLALWLPYVIWKVGYYGDFFPNTYYAKSAALAWWSQGWIYVRLYFEKYWGLALAIPLAIAAWLAPPRRTGAVPAATPAAPAPPAARAFPAAELLAAAMATGFTLYVMRVGGDFMYARMLVPVTPLFLIVLESAVARLVAGRPRVQLAATVGAIAAFALTPYPFKGSGWQGGIVNEREFYRPEDVEAKRAEGATLRRYFDGLPVSIAFVGSQARLAYDAHPAVAIEAQTGLTDRWIARQPLAHRGRVGHEKVAPVSYLLSRKVDFVIDHFATVTLDMKESLPMALIYFDRISGYMVHWDPPVLAELAKRGARFVDLPSALDERRAAYERLPADSLRMEYARLKRFYFDFVPDSVRAARFVR
jgi:hypothetical protein